MPKKIYKKNHMLLLVPKRFEGTIRYSDVIPGNVPAPGILDELDPSERKLFTDNIRRLDKRIHQGMTKLTWSSKGNSKSITLTPWKYSEWH